MSDEGQVVRHVVEESVTVGPVPTRPTKAVFAGLITLCGGLATALVDNSLTWAELFIVLGTVVTAVAAVYGITNQPKG